MIYFMKAASLLQESGHADDAIEGYSRIWLVGDGLTNAAFILPGRRIPTGA